MADVQLEKGHLRIANALNRAIIVAKFSDVQRRLVHLLVDQTYGWQRKTVEVSIAELAALLDLKASGGFRAALSELIEHRVVLQIRRGDGRARSVFAVEKDHEQWGKFAIASAFLAARFGKRPLHADALLGVSTDGATGDDGEDEGENEIDAPPDPEAVRDHAASDSPEGASPQAPSLVSEGASLQACSIEDASTEAPRVPAHSELGCLYTGTLTGSNSRIGETYERGKTGKPVELQLPHNSTARASEGALPEAPSTGERAFDPATVLQWEQLAALLATDHNRGHAIAFLATCTPDERNRLAPKFVMWLTGHDCPPSMQPSADELATALSEYDGDHRFTHVWAFVEDCIRRWRRAAGSGGGIKLRRDASGVTDAQRIATRLWELIKAHGLASCPPALVAGRIERMRKDGAIKSVEEFRALFDRVPLSRLAGAQKDFFAIQTIVEALSVDDRTVAVG